MAGVPLLRIAQANIVMFPFSLSSRGSALFPERILSVRPDYQDSTISLSGKQSQLASGKGARQLWQQD